MLNATGGWTSIDEELDATSTNPVQNKTLYNLETYHTLTKVGDGSFKIDDGKFPFMNGNSVKLFFKEDFSLSGAYYLMIASGPKNTQPKKVAVSSIRNFKIIAGGPHSSEGDEETYQDECFLHYHTVLIGFDSENNPKYIEKLFAKGTVVELILTPYNGDKGWMVVGDPIVGRYEYNRKYFAAPPWNITANAVVYASGLKIQWGNFNPRAASNDAFAVKGTYFPVKFENTPSMSFSYNNTDNNVARNDVPYAVDRQKWKINSGYEKNKGTWMAIGY